jgi:hypothetical protein
LGLADVVAPSQDQYPSISTAKDKAAVLAHLQSTIGEEKVTKALEVLEPAVKRMNRMTTKTLLTSLYYTGYDAAKLYKELVRLEQNLALEYVSEPLKDIGMEEVAELLDEAAHKVGAASDEEAAGKGVAASATKTSVVSTATNTTTTETVSNLSEEAKSLTDEQKSRAEQVDFYSQNRYNLQGIRRNTTTTTTSSSATNTKVELTILQSSAELRYKGERKFQHRHIENKLVEELSPALRYPLYLLRQSYHKLDREE